MKLRRTMLFVPGNNPGMISSANIYGADAIMFDLEDSVSMAEKDAARMLVYNALKTIDFSPCEVVVRVNPLDTPYGKQDIEAMVRGGAQVIRLPKTETAQDIIDTEKAIEEAEKAAGIPVGKTRMMAAIEGPLGVINAYAIATASKRLIAIALGAEDYSAAMKTTRSLEGTEL
ncbi:MAG: citrate lyase subunit beta, partial [Sphaerochaetaceae bacterium]|nr:citrate lyase subunit beta [Sphaerochaetaceae bacterium]